MGAVVSHSDFHLERVLSKSLHGEPLTKGEIRFLLDLKDEGDLDRLFRTAQEMRYRYFGEAIFLYGFAYFSTWCRNDCIFCRYRKSNPLAKRYRKDTREIIEIAGRLAESGVHLIDLTMGEDPVFSGNDQGGSWLVDLVKVLKAQTGLPMMVSPGVIPRKTLSALYAAGAEWYACYQETHNRKLFSCLRPNQDYNERLRRKREARQMGFLIEEGILTGAGDSSDDIVASIGAMKTLGSHQIRVMTFVPQEGTPLEHVPAPSPRRELVIIALMRLLFPDRLIPASLDVGGIGGLQDRLLAGANVVTSLIPPNAGLVGVSQSALDIDEGYRTVKGVATVLEKMGLKMATRNEYTQWVLHENGQAVGQDRQTGKMP
jgi:methylornithine synthase